MCNMSQCKNSITLDPINQLCRDAIATIDKADLLRIVEIPLFKEGVIGASRFELSEGCLNRSQHRGIALAYRDALGGRVDYRAANHELARILQDIIVGHWRILVGRVNTVGSQKLHHGRLVLESRDGNRGLAS